VSAVAAILNQNLATLRNSKSPQSIIFALFILRMTNEENIRGKRLKALLVDFTSKDLDKKIAAVQAMKMHGNETVIEALVKELSSTKHEELKEEIIELLNNTKSSLVPAKIIACLENKKYANCRQILLASIWNSGLDYREFLPQILTATLEGDIMDALECVTIVENFEGVPEDEELNEALVILGNYLSEQKKESSPKIDLLIELGAMLKRMNDES